MDLQHKEFNKNTIIIPVMVLVVIGAGYAASRLSYMMKPMTLDEYEQRYSTPEIPQPFFLR